MSISVPVQIPKHYARILYRVARASGKEVQIYEDLSRVLHHVSLPCAQGVAARCVTSDLRVPVRHAQRRPSIMEVIGAPWMPRDVAVQIADALLKALDVLPEVVRCVRSLARHRRMADLSAIVDAYLRLVQEQNGQKRLHIASAKPLSEADVSESTTVVEQAMGAPCCVYLAVDPTLIGGLVLTIDSWRIDASFSSVLTHCRRISL